MRTLIVILIACLMMISGTASAHECPHPNLGHLFLRLAVPEIKPDLSDREIIGAFWTNLKNLKDAAHSNTLEAYSVTHGHWVQLYGTPDELWAALNSSDRHMREFLRAELPNWRKNKPSNTASWWEGKACKEFGIIQCGCDE